MFGRYIPQRDDAYATRTPDFIPSSWGHRDALAQLVSKRYVIEMQQKGDVRYVVIKSERFTWMRGVVDQSSPVSNVFMRLGSTQHGSATPALADMFLLKKLGRLLASDNKRDEDDDGEYLQFKRWIVRQWCHYSARMLYGSDGAHGGLLGDLVAFCKTHSLSLFFPAASDLFDVRGTMALRKFYMIPWTCYLSGVATCDPNVDAVPSPPLVNRMKIGINPENGKKACEFAAFWQRMRFESGFVVEQVPQETSARELATLLWNKRLFMELEDETTQAYTFYGGGFWDGFETPYPEQGLLSYPDEPSSAFVV